MQTSFYGLIRSVSVPGRSIEPSAYGVLTHYRFDAKRS